MSRQSDQDAFLNKIPPHNLEAEGSLLSAILVDNRTVLEIIEVLAPEDFYSSANQIIYSSMLDLFSHNEPIDLITLSDHLQKNGKLEKAGGKVYLASFMDSIPAAVNAQYYATIVYERACLRRLIEKGSVIIGRCFENRGNVDEIIDFAERSIFEISESKNRSTFSPLSRIIEKNIDMLEERQGNRSLISGVKSCFTELDNLTAGLQNSDLIILAARPGMGKTAFALNLARNAAIESGVAVALFSLEMSKEQLSLRLLCAEAKVDSSRLRSGYFNQDDWERLTEAAGTLSEAQIFIDDTPNVSVLEIRAKSRRLKMNKDVGLIIVDYIQLMKAGAGLERRDLEISDISRSLKALAKELDLPVIGLSQLNRKLEERSDKRPQLSDLRESGALEQDADVVAFIYRDEVYNKDENNPNRGTAEIILAKQRNGPVGTVNLAFLNSYTRFENLAPQYLTK